MPSTPPPIDSVLAAVMYALCDLIATESAKTKAIVDLLELKGLLSDAEIRQAVQGLDPASVGAMADRLRTKLQREMARRHSEIVLHLAPTQGSTQ